MGNNTTVIVSINFSELKQQLEDVKILLIAMIDSMNISFSESTKKITKTFKDVGAQIESAIQDTVKKVKDLSDDITSSMEEGFNDLSDSIKASTNEINDTVGTAFNDVIDSTEELSDALSKNMDSGFNDIKDSMSDLSLETKKTAETLDSYIKSAQDTSIASAEMDQKNEKASKGFNSIKETAKNAISSLKPIGGFLKDIAENAFEMGTAFEDSMSTTAKLFGDVQVDADGLSDKILSLSNNTGIAATELSDGLASAIQAGIPVTKDMGEAMGFMENSAKLAKLTSSDLNTVIEASSKAMKGLGLDASESGKMQELLYKGFKDAKINAESMADALASMGSEAQTSGLSLDSIGATLMTMVQGGMSAENAASGFKDMLAEMTTEGSAASDAIKNLYDGKSLAQLSAEGIEFADVLSALESNAAQSGTSLDSLFDGSEAKVASLKVSGEGLKSLSENIANVSDSANGMAEAFNNTELTTSEKMAKMKTQMDNSLIEIFNAFLPLIDEILPVFQDLLGQLLPPITDLVAQLAGPLKDILDELLPVLGDIISAILPVLLDFINALVPIIDSFISAILPVLVELFEALAPVLVEIISTILPVLIEMFELLVPIIGDIITNVLPFLVQLFNELMPPIMQLIEALLPVLMDLFEATLPILEVLISLLQPILDLFMSILSPILDLIEIAIGPLIKIFGELIKMALEPVIGIFEKMGPAIEAVCKFFSDQINKIKNILNGVIDFFKNIFSGNFKAAGESLKNIFKNIFDGIIAAIKLPINLMIDVVNTLLKGLNGIKIPDWVPGIGGMSLEIPLIPKLATGGLAFGPALALIGDNPGAAIDPEVIAPLSRLRQMLSADLSFSSNQKMQNVVYVNLNANLEADGYNLARVVMRNIDDAAAFC